MTKGAAPGHVRVTAAPPDAMTRTTQRGTACLRLLQPVETHTTLPDLFCFFLFVFFFWREGVFRERGCGQERDGREGGTKCSTTGNVFK